MTVRLSWPAIPAVRKETGTDADDCRCTFFSYALCPSKSIWDSLARLFQEVAWT